MLMAMPRFARWLNEKPEKQTAVVFRLLVFPDFSFSRRRPRGRLAAISISYRIFVAS